jgi:hypothetical protein
MVHQQRNFNGHATPWFLEPVFTNSQRWTLSWVRFTLWHYFCNTEWLRIVVPPTRKSQFCLSIIKSAARKDVSEDLEQSNASHFQSEQGRNAYEA